MARAIGFMSVCLYDGYMGETCKNG